MVRLSQERKKLRFWRRVKLFGALFLCALIVSGLVYSVFFTHWFDIQNIYVNEVAFSSVQNIRDFIQQKIDKKVLYFVPRNLIILNIRGLKKDLTDDFYAVESIKVVRDFKNKALVFTVKEKQPQIIWCSHSNCVFLD